MTEDVGDDEKRARQTLKPIKMRQPAPGEMFMTPPTRKTPTSTNSSESAPPAAALKEKKTAHLIVKTETKEERKGDVSVCFGQISPAPFVGDSVRRGQIPPRSIRGE